MLEGKNLLALIGGALAVVGVFLPWASIMGLISLNGLNAGLPGYLSLLAGAAAIAFQFVKMPFGGVATLASCGIAFVLVLLNLVNAMSSGMASMIGFGLYISLAGLAVAAFGGFQDFQKSRQA